MQPNFSEKDLNLHYMDTASFTFLFKPKKELIENSKHFKEDFHFGDFMNFFRKTLKKFLKERN